MNNCKCNRGDKCHPLICYPTKAERVLAYAQVLRDNYPGPVSVNLSYSCAVELLPDGSKYIRIFDWDDVCAVCESNLECTFVDKIRVAFSDKISYMVCSTCDDAGRRLCNITGREIAECSLEYRNMMDRMYVVFKWMMYEFEIPPEIFMELFAKVVLMLECNEHI